MITGNYFKQGAWNKKQTCFVLAGIFLLLINPVLANNAMSYDAQKVKDRTGELLVFTEAPKRIISLNPSATEIVHAVEKDESIIGVTIFCPFEDLVREKVNIGTVLDPDVETIVSLKPDIVFATVEGNREQTVSVLRNAGIRVFVLNEINCFEDLFRRIRVVGGILGRGPRSEKLVQDMIRKLEFINGKVEGMGKKVHVFLQLGLNPIITVSKHTIMHELIELAGGKNIVEDSRMRYPIYSREAVIAGDPDVILIASMGSFEKEAMREWLTYDTIKAVRDGRVYNIDPALICHIGPRLANGVEEVARILYPDLFTKPEAM